MDKDLNPAINDNFIINILIHMHGPIILRHLIRKKSAKQYFAAIVTLGRA